MKKDIKIPRPSVKEVEKYLKIWNSKEEYFLSEHSLNKLFLKTYPQNNNIYDVLAKVCLLNDIYGTHILSPFKISKNIVSKKIDLDLAEGNLNVVDKIAKAGIKVKKTTKEIYFYSFATKYCSHHNSSFYPIYDSYIEKILIYFKKEDKFYSFKKEELKNYSEFKKVIISFIKYYNLGLFNFKQIDQYLWLLGKDYLS